MVTVKILIKEGSPDQLAMYCEPDTEGCSDLEYTAVDDPKVVRRSGLRTDNGSWLHGSARSQGQSYGQVDEEIISREGMTLWTQKNPQ